LTPDATPGANAAAVRRAIDALNAGDVGGLLTMAHADIEWEVVPEHPAATTHRGFDAVREYHEDWRNTLDDLRLDVLSIAEDGDSVVAICRIHGKGAESGADVEVRQGAPRNPGVPEQVLAFQVRDGVPKLPKPF
jgi:ketosteroid isomerase-like protein